MNREEMLKELKLIRFTVFFVMAVFMILFTIFIYEMFVTTGFYYPKIFSYTEEIYINLSDEERRNANEIINSVDPLYKQFVRSITVMGDMIEYCENKKTIGCAACLKHGCGGFIDTKQNVVLTFFNKKQFAIVLCHEVIHSISYSGGDWDKPHHQVVFDLSEKLVCYKS